MPREAIMVKQDTTENMKYGQGGLLNYETLRKDSKRNWWN